MNILIVGGHDESFFSLLGLKFKFIILQHIGKIGDNQKKLTEKIIQINYTDINKLIEKVREIHQNEYIDFVFSFTEDGLYPAAKISDYFSIKGINKDTCELCINKIKLRDKLKKTDFHVPYKSCNNIIEMIAFYNEYGPNIILKDRQESGSKDVFIVTNEKMLKDRCEYFEKNNNLPILLEKYIEGDEYSLESLTIRGKHEFIGATKKFVHQGTTIEEKHIFPAPDLSSEMLNKLSMFTKEILNIINHKHGPCHLEVKIDDENISLIEINNRAGGDYIWKMVKLVKGIDLVKETIELFSAGFPDEKTRLNNSKFSIMGSIFFFKKFDAYILENSIKKYFKDIIQLEIFESEVEEILSSDDRYGFLLVGENENNTFITAFNKIDKLLISK